MYAESIISGQKNGEKSLIGRQSKTVRKFTRFFGEDSLPECVSINLDWLSFQGICTMPEPEPEQPPAWVTKDMVLEYENRGIAAYKHSYKVFLQGEQIANLHTHGRNEKIIKPGTVKVEICNPVLYSSTVNEVIPAILDAFNMQMKNISRLDIAIDGTKHIHKLVNMYNFQNRDRSGMPLRECEGIPDALRWDKGCKIRLKGRANFDPKRLNRETGLMDSFKIGAGHKYISIYEKTQELKKSCKNYISDAWAKAEIDTSGEVWRCELRMDSQAVKEIKDFDLKRISDPYYLLQIFKTQCKNFFEFVINEGDANVSRMRSIDLFQFEKLRIPLLEKIPRAIVRGAFKAKMAIHHVFQCVLLNYYQDKEAVMNALKNAADTVEIYKLHKWQQYAT